MQSLNDFIIFGIMAVGSFASGGLLAARLAHGAVGLVHSLALAVIALARSAAYTRRAA